MKSEDEVRERLEELEKFERYDFYPKDAYFKERGRIEALKWVLED